MLVDIKILYERDKYHAWWCTLLISAHRKQRQVDLCEFKATLIYVAQSLDIQGRERSGDTEIQVFQCRVVR